MRRYFFFLVAILCNFSLFAKVDFHIEDNGCFFRILASNEIELVRCSSSRLDDFARSADKKGRLPYEVRYGDKLYKLTSIGDSVFGSMPDLTLVVPHTLKHIGSGNDVKAFILSAQGQYLDSYGGVVVDRGENRIVWTNPASREAKVVRLPKNLHKLPENLLSSFPMMEVLTSPNIDTLTHTNTVIAYNDTIYMIDSKGWQWISPQCAYVERLTADASWNDVHIQVVEQYFPNLRRIRVKPDKKGTPPSPYISICGALCYKDGKGIAHIPAQMKAEADTLTISQQLVEHIPADFFTQFSQLKHVDIIKSKSNKALVVKQNGIYYKSRLIAEVPCEIKENAYDIVEREPEFPGGMGELMKYLQRNIKYPAICQKQGIQGRVIVQFVINSDGSIVDAQVIKSVNPHLDKEALRIITKMPKWQPGIRRDKPVRVRFTLPVTFRLSNNAVVKVL